MSVVLGMSVCVVLTAVTENNHNINMIHAIIYMYQTHVLQFPDIH